MGAFKQCVANDELWTRMTHQEKRSLCLSIYLYCGQVSLTKYHLHDQASMVVYYKVKLGEPRSRENVWHFLFLSHLTQYELLTEVHIMAESRWYSIPIKNKNDFHFHVRLYIFFSYLLCVLVKSQGSRDRGYILSKGSSLMIYYGCPIGRLWSDWNGQ